MFKLREDADVPAWTRSGKAFLPHGRLCTTRSFAWLVPKKQLSRSATGSFYCASSTRQSGTPLGVPVCILPLPFEDIYYGVDVTDSLDRR